MPSKDEVLYLEDFTGGLNLTTQQQGLLPNESPDALNVDFGLRGGFMLRGGFQSQDYDAVWNGCHFLGPTYFNDDVFLVRGTGGSLYEWDGATLTDTGHDVTDDVTDRVRMDTFNRKAYFANGQLSGAIVMRSYDGTSLNTLNNNWNNTLASPVGNSMPKARFIREHNGFMWVADTVESGTRYPHRVRFSHLQQPEDWREVDYFDLDPHDDGDPITAIEKFRETLLIFKRTAVYAVYGYDKDTFVVERVTDKSGVCTCGAASGNSSVMYWFATDGRLMAYNGRGVVPVSNALRWWSDIGKIQHGGAHMLRWYDDKLFMRLEAGSGEAVSFWTFVYDPSVGDGVITRYDPDIQEMGIWPKIGVDADPLFVFQGDQNLYRFDRSYSNDTVDDGSGPVSAPIRGYYRTGWITASETATKKRWKRPRITAASDADATIRVGVYHDFDEVNQKRSSDFFITTGDNSLWDTMNWGDDWAGADDDFYTFARQPSAGSSRAVQFKISSPDNLGRWWVDSVALPFRRKRIR